MRTLEKMINIRRKGLETHEDFLQCLLAEDAVDKDRTSSSNSSSSSSSSSETPKKLTDEEIQDNILTMIIAGDQNLQKFNVVYTKKGKRKYKMLS